MRKLEKLEEVGEVRGSWRKLEEVGINWRKLEWKLRKLEYLPLESVASRVEKVEES